MTDTADERNMSLSDLSEEMQMAIEKLADMQYAPKPPEPDGTADCAD